MVLTRQKKNKKAIEATMLYHIFINTRFDKITYDMVNIISHAYNFDLNFLFLSLKMASKLFIFFVIPLTQADRLLPQTYWHSLLILLLPDATEILILAEVDLVGSVG